MLLSLQLLLRRRVGVLIRMAAVPFRPLLAPWYRVAEVDGAIAFEHAQAVVRLDGAAARSLVPRLLPLLDGTRTVDEIVACVGEAVRPAVDNALTVLAGRRLLVDGPPLDEADGDSVARLLAGTAPGMSEADVAQALAAAHVAVAGSGRLALEVARALRQAGIGAVAPADWDAVPDGDLAVAAPARDELTRLAGWNELALAAGRDWLQVLPFDGRFGAVGPLFVPGETCCHRCYRLRRHANVPYPDEFEAVESQPLAAATPPLLAAALAGLAALVAARWLALRDPLLPARLHTLELRPALSLEEHLVYRVPRCPACSHTAVGGRPLPWFKETGAEAA